ncbi:MAG: carboxypeptidase regulatory-like domain-containing protein [Steroidobacterales bacterium]
MRPSGWAATFCTISMALAGCAQLAPTPSISAPSAAPLPAAVVVYATGPGGAPLRDALVYLHAAAPTAMPDPAPASLDLMDRAFEPRVLAVPAGTTVTFHNLDAVDHDVYSFSAPKPLSLHLPAQSGVAPLTFLHSGVVVLGCKVHDEMVGYVYVADTPYFGKTDADGYVRLGGLPPGSYTLGIWQVGTPEKDAGGLRTFTLGAGAELAVRIRL